MKKVNLIVLLLSLSFLASAQDKETINQEIVFEKASPENVFILANINGHVSIEAWEGDKIILQAEKTLNAKTQERLELAKSEIGVGIIDRVDTILVYIKSPCNPFDKRTDGKRYSNNDPGWGYNWEKDCNHRDAYDFQFDFTLKVPSSMNLYISTINDGDISVLNVKGNLSLHNINGSIVMEAGEGSTIAHTINGDVDLKYTRLPKGTSSYYTLNGDINAWYPKNFGADVSFKSHNGDMFTDIKEIEIQPAILEKTASKEKGISFKVESRSSIRIRDGGVRLDFETFNGNVYLHEQ